MRFVSKLCFASAIALSATVSFGAQAATAPVVTTVFTSPLMASGSTYYEPHSFVNGTLGTNWIGYFEKNGSTNTNKLLLQKVDANGLASGLPLTTVTGDGYLGYLAQSAYSFDRMQSIATGALLVQYTNSTGNYYQLLDNAGMPLAPPKLLANKTTPYLLESGKVLEVNLVKQFFGTKITFQPYLASGLSAGNAMSFSVPNIAGSAISSIKIASENTGAFTAAVGFTPAKNGTSRIYMQRIDSKGALKNNMAMVASAWGGASSGSVVTVDSVQLRKGDGATVIWKTTKANAKPVVSIRNYSSTGGIVKTTALAPATGATGVNAAIELFDTSYLLSVDSTTTSSGYSVATLNGRDATGKVVSANLGTVNVYEPGNKTFTTYLNPNGSYTQLKTFTAQSATSSNPDLSYVLTRFTYTP